MPNKTALAPWLLTLALVGCSTLPPTYRELEARDRTFSEVWVSLQQVTRRLGYAADRDETDRGRRVFQSVWNTRLTFPRGSTRHRVRVEAERIGPDQPGWLVRCYVEQQKVENIARSVSPRDEDWEPAGQDDHRERVFVGTLRAELGLEVIAPTSWPKDEESTRIR
ncbi:MAG: hypothetical protein ACYST0_07905 [Planctomycetota bacterium]|jgi:hypothetical protein